VSQHSHFKTCITFSKDKKTGMCVPREQASD